MGRRLTKQEFINRAVAKHGEIYDYSEVIYVGIDDKVKIKCLKHGIFEKSPYEHLNGSGCNHCKIRKNISIRILKEEWITRFRKTHGDKYDYSNVIIRNSNTKIKIICPKHGEFEQMPYSHAEGRGCPSCGIDVVKVKNAITQKDFIDAAHTIHNGKYDYSNSVYTNRQNKTIIGCPIHGLFTQRPGAHLQGEGCPKCGKLKNGQKSLFRGFKKSDFIHKYAERLCTLYIALLYTDNLSEKFIKVGITGRDVEKKVLYSSI